MSDAVQVQARLPVPQPQYGSRSIYRSMVYSEICPPPPGRRGQALRLTLSFRATCFYPRLRTH